MELINHRKRCVCFLLKILIGNILGFMLLEQNLSDNYNREELRLFSFFISLNHNAPICNDIIQTRTTHYFLITVHRI